LPASKKEITIGKFYMVILPIFKKIEQDAVDLKETRKQGKKEEGEKMYDQLKQSVNNYIDLIESSDQLSLGIKVNAQIQFYSIFSERSGMKALSLQRLTALLHKHN
jgi:hypothetical protein